MDDAACYGVQHMSTPSPQRFPWRPVFRCQTLMDLTCKGQHRTCPTSNAREAQLVAQFAAAWEEGKCTSVEQFFADDPHTCADPEVAVRLIYEEYLPASGGWRAG